VDEEGEVGKMGPRSRREGRQDPGQGIGGENPEEEGKGGMGNGFEDTPKVSGIREEGEPVRQANIAQDNIFRYTVHQPCAR